MALLTCDQEHLVETEMASVVTVFYHLMPYGTSPIVTSLVEVSGRPLQP